METRKEKVSAKVKVISVVVFVIIVVAIYSVSSVKKIENIDFENEIRIHKQTKKMLEYINRRSSSVVCGKDKQYCSRKGTVTITFVHSDEIELFQNWYVASKRSGIDNIAVVAFSSKAAKQLKAFGVDIYFDDVFEDDETLSKRDKHKWEHHKLRIIAEILNEGYAVLVSGINVVFLKDPYQHFTCTDCDFEIMNMSPNSKHIKPSFDLCMLKPVKGSQQLLQVYSKQLHKDKHSSSGRIFQQIVTGNARSEFYYVTLDFKLFTGTGTLDRYYNGKKERLYTPFKNGERLAISSDPSTIVTFHSHVESGPATHRYIFRELGLWYVDTDKYYSDTNSKYIIYGNYNYANESDKRLLGATTFHCAFAISRKLNRTLILPRFHCKEQEHKLGCTLLAMYHNIDRFDLRYANRYREHSFLTNPLVPDAILNKQSPILFVPGRYDDVYPPSHAPKGENVKLLQAKNLILGPTMKEMRTWLEELNHYSVLRFYNLHFACETLKSSY